MGNEGELRDFVKYRGALQLLGELSRTAGTQKQGGEILLKI